MAHLVSSDKDLLIRAGQVLGLIAEWLQYKPLKHPVSGRRVEAWHWDLRNESLETGITLAGPRVAAGSLQAVTSSEVPELR